MVPVEFRLTPDCDFCFSACAGMCSQALVPCQKVHWRLHALARPLRVSHGALTTESATWLPITRVHLSARVMEQLQLTFRCSSDQILVVSTPLLSTGI